MASWEKLAFCLHSTGAWGKGIKCSTNIYWRPHLVYNLFRWSVQSVCICSTTSCLTSVWTPQTKIYSKERSSPFGTLPSNVFALATHMFLQATLPRTSITLAPREKYCTLNAMTKWNMFEANHVFPCARDYVICSRNMFWNILSFCYFGACKFYCLFLELRSTETIKKKFPLWKDYFKVQLCMI